MESREKVKAIIVDDEIDARKNLQYLLQNYEDEVEVVGESENASSARELISAKDVDLIFLDIAMPRESGFELLKSLPDYAGEVIFVTSYNQHAEKAFKYFALGYITKPVDKNEFKAVLQNTLDIISLRKTRAISFKHLAEHLGTENTGKKNLIVPTLEGYEIIDKSRISYIEAQRNYSRIVADDGDLIVSRNLAVVADMLEGNQFMRVHKSYLVNVSRIRKITFEGSAKMEDGSEIRISQKNREAVLRRLSDG